MIGNHNGCSMLEALKISDQDLQNRRFHKPLTFSAAVFWNKYMPRGKGSIPRFIGKSFAATLANCNIADQNGIKYAVSPRSLDVYAALYHDGKWDKHVFATCKEVLSEGDVFYDLGANIGVMSLMLAKAYEDKITIYSFEPQPDLSRAIAVSAKINNFQNIHVYEAMLGEQNEETDLFLSEHSVHASSVARADATQSIKRKMYTIDALVDSQVIRPPDVIKIDVEGGELATFKGAKHTLSRHKPKIIFENDNNTERFGYQREDILRLLKSYADYEFFYIDRQDFSQIKVDEENLQSQYTDILAVPKL